MDLREFLSETKPLPRWMVLMAALVGAGCGAMLMFFLALAGIVL